MHTPITQKCIWLRLDKHWIQKLLTICIISIQINHNGLVVMALRMPSEVNLTNTQLGNPPTSPGTELSLKILKIFFLKNFQGKKLL